MARTPEQQAYSRAYYEANRDAIKARVREHAAANRDKIRAWAKAYRDANAEQLRAVSKAYYEANREERIAYQKELHAANSEARKAYMKLWWEKNREAFAAARKTPQARAAINQRHARWFKEDYAKHPEKWAARVAKRKARKLGSSAEMVSYKQILRDSKGICGICKKPFDLFGIEFDHIVPLARGGTHTRANIQATHSYCNRSKGARLA